MVEQLNSNTKVAGIKWEVLREHALRADYKEQCWYSELSESDKEKLETLRDMEQQGQISEADAEEER